ncbi:hypothetical protein B296_00028243 [Ensete ventricosum]|uniref:Uncharacterized protein n=1 Tax=Ensete ventricosum TaxID=4639 RepID=A0A427ANE6_ENSVE|nr:hypothetical protein B296_00028243 [Ensete ventricosum]
MTVTWLDPPLRATAIALCEPSRTLPCAQGPRVRILRAIITVPPPSLGEGNQSRHRRTPPSSHESEAGS